MSHTRLLTTPYLTQTRCKQVTLPPETPPPRFTPCQALATAHLSAVCCVILSRVSGTWNHTRGSPASLTEKTHLEFLHVFSWLGRELSRFLNGVLLFDPSPAVHLQRVSAASRLGLLRKCCQTRACARFGADVFSAILGKRLGA